MSAEGSLAVRYYGTDQSVDAPTLLRAGPLTVEFDAGNLRYARISGVEAMRGIAFIVRDRNWGTYAPAITNLEIDQRRDGFTVTYDARCNDAEQELHYSARITGDADGTLRFEGRGRAVTDFVTNRTGFVVLHPVEGIAGHWVSVERTDGSVEESTFPAQIDPMCPFQDLRALTHEVMPGVRVTCRMEGDAFEMEDHRNWMDASYKTYVRPLALPWPYTIGAGETTEQSLTLSVSGAAPASASSAGADSVSVAIGDEAGRMPEVGISLKPEHRTATSDVAEAVRTLGPGFLVCPFDSRIVDGWSAAPAVGLSTFSFDERLGRRGDVLAHYRRMGEITGAPLILEAVVACRDAEGGPSADLAVMRRDLEAIAGAVREAELDLSAIVVSPASDLKCTLPGSVWPPCPPAEAIIAATRELFPGLAVGGGMLSFFTELNRKRPPAELLDFVTHTTCPIVHASDDRTVTENLEALPHIILSTRSFTHGKPYRIGPSAIGARDNPYGAASSENPANGRVALARMDPRQRGLLGAAWHLGYAAQCARGGVEAITLSAPIGEAGLIHQRMDYGQPWFDAHGGVYPAYHVVRGMAAASGAARLETAVSAPDRLQAVAHATDHGRTLWLANLTAGPLDVRLDGLTGRSGHVAVLDHATFAGCCAGPDGFDRGERMTGVGSIRLDAYAVARLRLGTA